MASPQQLYIDQDMYDELLRHASRYTTNRRDAEDLVQETCCNAYRSFSTYDPERATVQGWLNTRMRTEASRIYRRSKANLAKISRIREQPRDHFTFADSSADVDALDQFKYCIRILTPAERAVMTEIYLHERTGVEAARVLDLTPGAVRKRAQRAFRKLRKCTLAQSNDTK